MDIKSEEQDMVYNSCLTPYSSLPYNTCDQWQCFSTPPACWKSRPGGYISRWFQGSETYKQLDILCWMKIAALYTGRHLFIGAMHDHRSPVSREKVLHVIRAAKWRHSFDTGYEYSVCAWTDCRNLIRDSGCISFKRYFSSERYWRNRWIWGFLSNVFQSSEFT